MDLKGAEIRNIGNLCSPMKAQDIKIPIKVIINDRIDGLKRTYLVWLMIFIRTIGKNTLSVL